MQIRAAKSADAPGCVELVEARRAEYEKYEPKFWKKAVNSAASTLPWFEALFADARSMSFVIAREFPTPPVYDPGGATALIDDFCVVLKSRWQDVGQALLREAKSEMKKRGFAQVVVVGAHRDLEKTAFLRDAGLSLASTWWTSGV